MGTEGLTCDGSAPWPKAIPHTLCAAFSRDSWGKGKNPLVRSQPLPGESLSLLGEEKHSWKVPWDSKPLVFPFSFPGSLPLRFTEHPSLVGQGVLANRRPCSKDAAVM